MDVVAETTLEVTKNALYFNWSGYGLSLSFPRDSLPADCRCCIVKIKASLPTEYGLPEGYEFVSDVYWIYCQMKFSKPVALNLQYDSMDTEDLSFVRAECTQKQLPYTFREVKGGEFLDSSSYSSISVTRFSGWGVIDKIRSRRYTAQLHYSRAGLNMWNVLIAITCNKNLDLDHAVCVYIVNVTCNLGIYAI